MAGKFKIEGLVNNEWLPAFFSRMRGREENLDSRDEAAHGLMWWKPMVEIPIFAPSPAGLMKKAIVAEEYRIIEA